MPRAPSRICGTAWCGRWADEPTRAPPRGRRDAAGGRDHFAIFIVHSEGQTHETPCFWGVADDMGKRGVEGHVVEGDMWIGWLDFHHDGVNGNTHGAHAPATDHDIFIVFEHLMEFAFAGDMLQIRLQDHNWGFELVGEDSELAFLYNLQ